MDSMDDASFLARLLRRAHLSASRRYRRHLAAFDFAPGEARVLMSVLDAPGVTPSALADSADVDPPTVTGVVDRLVARGYLRREPDPRDRRRQLLFATDAGDALRSRILEARRASEVELEGMLGADDTARLRDLLARFLEAEGRPAGDGATSLSRR
jgi:DNA-binding MarR family transcriptional regulator